MVISFKKVVKAVLIIVVIQSIIMNFIWSLYEIRLNANNIVNLILYELIPFCVCQLSLFILLFPKLLIKHKRTESKKWIKILLIIIVLHTIRVYFFIGIFSLFSVSEDFSEMKYLFELLLPVIVCFISLFHSLFYLCFKV